MKDFQFDSQHGRCIEEIREPMTFDLCCKVTAIIDTKDNPRFESRSSERGPGPVRKVFRVTDGTRCRLQFIAVKGKLVVSSFK